MNDIFKNGPVVAAMQVYEDFACCYRRGKFLQQCTYVDIYYKPYDLPVITVYYYYHYTHI